jgi:hypothetical protein
MPLTTVSIAAKVSNFYIFGGDEIDIKESAHLCVRAECSTFVLFAMALVLLLLPQTLTV